MKQLTMAELRAQYKKQKKLRSGIKGISRGHATSMAKATARWEKVLQRSREGANIGDVAHELEIQLGSLEDMIRRRHGKFEWPIPQD